MPWPCKKKEPSKIAWKHEHILRIQLYIECRYILFSACDRRVHHISIISKSENWLNIYIDESLFSRSLISKGSSESYSSQEFCYT